MQRRRSYSTKTKTKGKSMKLTNNFSLKELTQSQTALRNGLDNTPADRDWETNFR